MWIFSTLSRKQLYNHKCLSICSYVHPSSKPPSTIILHLSTFILHFATFKLFTLFSRHLLQSDTKNVDIFDCCCDMFDVIMNLINLIKIDNNIFEIIEYLFQKIFSINILVSRSFRSLITFLFSVSEILSNFVFFFGFIKYHTVGSRQKCAQPFWL